jgi:hypothetical protein
MSTNWNDLFSGDKPKDKPKEEVKENSSDTKIDTPTETRPSQQVSPTKEIERPVEKSVQEPALPADKESPIIKEVVEDGGEVYTIYGLKGNGKTFLCYSFPGDIAVLSFDGKSYSIKKHQYDNDSRIRVYNAREKLDETTADAWLQTSELTFRHINEILEQLGNGKLPKPDWIVIDGHDQYTQIAEMTMRYRNNLQPYQGISNFGIWKERRQYLRQLHYKALQSAKRGIIYTAYVDSKPSKVQFGQTITQKDKPAWFDVVESESDVVLKVESEVGENGTKYNCYVDSAKTRIPINNQSKFDISKFEYDKTGTPTERTVWGIRAIFPQL